MGIGPVPAINNALEAAGKKITDMDLCDVRYGKIFDKIKKQTC